VCGKVHNSAETALRASHTVENLCRGGQTRNDSMVDVRAGVNVGKRVSSSVAGGGEVEPICSKTIHNNSIGVARCRPTDVSLIRGVHEVNLRGSVGRLDFQKSPKSGMDVRILTQNMEGEHV
jgi:hypothetical protein